MQFSKEVSLSLYWNLEYHPLARLTRMVSQQNQDGTTKYWCYDGVQTNGQPNCHSHVSSSSGEWVDSADENGNDWQRTNDAFGRLTSAIEPNGTSKSPSMETDYTYDILGNLLGVTQYGGAYGSSGSRGRSFTYDGMLRLLTAYNPESGTVTYTYDGNGNVLTKTSPLVNLPSTSPSVNTPCGMQTLGYSYDALNRLVAKSITAPSSGCPSPSPTTNSLDVYAFDAAAGGSNDVGRLTDEKAYVAGTLVAEDSPYAYHAMGWLLNEQQSCALSGCSGVVYTPSYNYNWAGGVKSVAAGLPGAVSGAPAALGWGLNHDQAGLLSTAISTVAENANYPSKLFQATAYSPVGLANANIGVNVSGNSTLLNLARTYDTRARALTETDTTPNGSQSIQIPTVPASKSTGSLTVSGSEVGPLSNSGTKATGAFSVSGYENCTYQGYSCPWDTGYVYVTIGSFTSSAYYSQGSSSQSVASSLAAGFNVGGSPVTATVTGNGTSVTVTATTVGSNPAFSSYTYPYSGADFNAYPSGSTLTGGRSAVSNLYDAGTITATVGGITTAAVTWGQGSTTSSIATALASKINSAAGSIVGASASGATIYLTSTTAGSNVNYSVSATVTDTQLPTYSYLISGPSFSVSTQSMLGGTAASSPVNGLIYSYALPASGGYDSVGDVLSSNDSVMGAWTYSYDTLDRLSAGRASTGAYQNQYSCWAYDAWGNRTVQSYQSSSCANLTTTASYNTKNQVTSVSQGWPTSVSAPGGFTYDAAGNVLNDGAHNYLYDPEGRVCEVSSAGPSYTAYFYDAEGRRAAKGALSSWQSSCPAPSAVTSVTSYELGLGGEQMTEVAINGSSRQWQHTNVFAGGRLLATYASGGSNTPVFSIPLTDWLGSKRAEVGILSNGAGCSTFFQELAYGDALTTVGGANPCNDATEHHFTGKERDAESGNDYFGARYYGSSMGRFMSPDPLPWIHWQNGNRDAQQRFGAYIANPQNFNMYAYVNNNPLNHTDPTGMNACGTKDDSSCKVTVTINDRSKDANGKYNDQYTNVKNQANYNATAVVNVKGKDVGTFLIKTTPSDASKGAPLAAGVYSGTLTKHNGDWAIRINPTLNLPTNGPNRNQGGAWFATGDLIHAAGWGNGTGGNVSTGCLVVCTSQYGSFEDATGMSADPPQRHFTVDVNASDNLKFDDPVPPGPPQS